MIGNQLSSAFIFVAIVTLAAGKPPPPPGAPWAKFVSKPAVFERSLGPPPMSGVSTFQIPYIPKPSMFPKFVDPRIMISKKTDLLSNLFGGMGPAIGTPGFGSPSPYAGYGSSPYMYPGSMYNPEESTPDSTSDDVGDNSDLPILYGSGYGPKTSYFDSTSSNLKRGLLGPMGSKSMFGGSFGPKGPMASPFYGGSGSDPSALSNGPPFFKRGILGPKMLPLVSPLSGSTDPLQRESSTDITNPEVEITTQKSPPSYPKISVIPEEVEEPKESALEKIFSPSGDAAASKSSKDLSKRMVADDSIPKEYLPGMYGPMGPMFGPPGGVFGPDAFMSKKSTFLDTLFKNLATSTISPVATETPVPEKSTIVPPGFWLPESVVPDPGSYNAKVGIFLDKLFDSLKLNASTAAGDSPAQTVTYEESISAGFPGGKSAAARSLPLDYSAAGYSPLSSEATKSIRSLADPETVITAKDQIVSSIIAELGILKDDMMATFNELIAYQKNLTAPLPGAKPFKPFASPFWPSPAVTAADIGTLPYKRRMLILDQVFDMLTELQTNVSLAVNQAVISSSGEDIPEPEVQTTTTVKPDDTMLNISILDAIQAKLDDLNTIGLTKVGPKGIPPKFSRALPASPSSFWVAYPGGDSARRNLYGDQQGVAEENGKEIEDPLTNGKDSRAIKMQMHQGYQSLPPGAIQSIQAGGGSVPGHEGGGVKLLIKMPAYDTATRDVQNGQQDYQDYLKWQDWSKTMGNKWEDDNRHHHH